ncbi:MAG: cytochrome c oxidase subunit I [Opitutae bacterium]|jgi:cytochrome c oxidase subunit I|nr:cytochrome c oxidase subunit I [Opitutae bacterium]MBT4665875.1 cytochrome c oxidase subunit I [Opitutae bacterium]MBT5908598.1 cytochrome c oxidase subunit I [Opitutae bacterium]MBT6852226.1 cytochrome c oxidase subunit I [Opitutae bacterium]MBT7741487.1 cytochrome c oxidase subunit I [Opitutae bacterium]
MTEASEDESQKHAQEKQSSHKCSKLRSWLFSTDHKVIAFQYIITGMLMAVIGGYMAYVFRMQLAFPGEEVPGFGWVSPGNYNALVTNHGTIMIFWVAMPILLAGFGNFLIPLMIGCDDMVFPRLNRLSFQIFFISALVIIASLHVAGGGFGGAWTAYPPLSTNPDYNLTPLGAVLWVVAVALEFVAFLIGGINFVTTTMNARAPGMGMMRIPLVVWMIVIASILFMVSVGPLIAGAVMLLSDQLAGTAFYDPTNGGDPLLWQHLFWFFGHPEVYVVLLPAMGVVAEIIPVFARKKFFGYKAALYVTIATGVLSFFVWAHHQFVSGIDPRMAHLFTVTTLLISVPIAELCFLFIATLFGGSIEFRTPMLWAIAFLVEFLLGGVTGIYLGSSGSDIYFHDTYFVVAHFHYTFFPIAIIGMFAGITHWFPKAFGRHLNEKWGKIHFWGTIIPFNFIFIPMFFLGLGGQHRRIFDYRHFPELALNDLQDLRILATVATCVLIAFQIPFVINFFRSMRKGKEAGENPWNATTLEWSTSSPPPHGNWETLPTVHRGPYEYGIPEVKEDYLPQHIETPQTSNG